MMQFLDNGRGISTIRFEQCEQVAAETLGAFQSAGNPLKLPIDIEQIASMMEYQVVRLTDVPDEFSAIVSTRDRLIGINAAHHRHRQRFSIGHELGHILLDHPPEAKRSRIQIDLDNREADYCAAALLMPKTIVREFAERTSNVTELSRVFDVSKEAMARRLKLLGITTKDGIQLSKEEG
ncbi:MAG TPA: ImmA/IrrE family metallo-endopeptidase [Bacteroidota bacterium]|nr:ImmA/IrrE family metallo-endopeptidase [Bacteroidota bacterium]